MKALLLLLCLGCASPGWAQSSAKPIAPMPLPALKPLHPTKVSAAQHDADESTNEKYLSFSIALVGGNNGEIVVPMKYLDKGDEHIEFIPPNQLEESAKRGDKFISLGELVSALNQQIQAVNKLQAKNAELSAENEKLWKVAMKANPAQTPPAPQTVIVHEPPSQAPSRLERYMLLRSLLPHAQPTQNVHVTISNCTRFPALCVGR